MSNEGLQDYHIQVIDVLMISIVVLFVGMFLTRKIRFLESNCIPPRPTFVRTHKTKGAPLTAQTQMQSC